MRGAWVLMLAIGCGRFDFDPLGAGGTDAHSGDASNSDTASGSYCASLPSPFCASITGAALCDDFDDGQPLGNGWNMSLTQTGGMMSLSTANACSAGTSVMHAFPTQTNGNSIAQLEYDNPSASSVDFAFDLLIPMRTPNSQIEIADITVVASAGKFNTDLMLDVGTGVMDSFHEEFFPTAGVGQSADHVFAEIAPGVWHHVEMAIDFSAQTQSLMLDGVLINSGATAFAIEPGALSVYSGIIYAFGMLAGWTLFVDNVVIRVT